MTWFEWKAIFKSVLLPPVGLVLLALVTSQLRGRYARAATGLALLAVTLLSVPLVGRTLVATLQTPNAFTLRAADGAGAIVILGGGTRRNAPEYGGDTVGALTLERVRYGAHVAKLTGLPVLVSGGGPPDMASEAELMRTVLEEFGVHARWIEPRSHNTHENARYSAPILKSAGITKVILVNHAFDIRRAVAEFEEAGIACVPAATNLVRTRSWDDLTLFDWIPGLPGLQASYYALYEMTANLTRHLVR